MRFLVAIVTDVREPWRSNMKRTVVAYVSIVFRPYDST